MRFSVRILILGSLLVCVCFCQRANSQTKPAPKNAKATVSGKVTIKGKPATGIVVSTRLNRDESSSRNFTARTDQEGAYHITGLSEGSYYVEPVAPALVISDSEPMGQSVVIAAGENIEGINFDLARGGVITGKVVDADGHPIVEEQINLVPADYPRRGPAHLSGNFQTDDRGIYRIFGIRPGKYKVSIGEEGNGIDDRVRRGRSPLPETYYPDSHDVAKALVIEVGEGTEATNIDITVGGGPEGFAVTGRVVESESGKPVRGVPIYLEKITIIDANTTSGRGSATNVRSDSDGAFRLEKVQAGKYSVSIQAPAESDLRAEQVPFDIVDQDVTGLLIKTSRGGTLTGTVIVESSHGGNITGAQEEVWVSVNLNNNEQGYSSNGSAQVKPDGSFRVGGLLAGTVTFSVGTWGATGNAKPMTISRVERDGVLQPNGIQIQDGEAVSGVRIIAAKRNGSIRGVVKVENGTLPPSAHLAVVLSKIGDVNFSTGGGWEVDSRRHFLIEGLATGTYEVQVMVYVPEWRGRRPTSKQLVSVTDGTATDVMLTIDLTPVRNQ